MQICPDAYQNKLQLDFETCLKAIVLIVTMETITYSQPVVLL